MDRVPVLPKEKTKIFLSIQIQNVNTDTCKNRLKIFVVLFVQLQVKKGTSTGSQVCGNS